MFKPSFIDARLGPSDHTSFVGPASGFNLHWKGPPPPNQPLYHMQTVTGKAALLARTEGQADQIFPLVGLCWRHTDLMLPEDTTLIDESIPIQFVARTHPGRETTALYKAKVSVRAATRLRSHWARHHPGFLTTFFVEPKRTAYLANLDPLLIWVYGPPVPMWN